MGIRCECDCDFRFKNNRIITAFFLTAGFTLSFLSNLDCFFVEVDVGFTPSNSYFKTSKLGIGLWTFEDPDVRGQCIAPLLLKGSDGDLTKGDQLYAQLWTNGDVPWGIARIVASCGLCIGFAAMIFVWVCICLDTSHDYQILLTIIITTFALACEGTKFGLFFETKPCTSDDFWERDEMNKVKAETCLLSRGTYMSIFSLTSYSIVIIYQLLAKMYPAYDHVEMDEFEYDDVTLPSFLGSIGKSVVSKTSSAMSSILGSQISSSDAKSKASSGMFSIGSSKTNNSHKTNNSNKSKDSGGNISNRTNSTESTSSTRMDFEKQESEVYSRTMEPIYEAGSEDEKDDFVDQSRARSVITSVSNADSSMLGFSRVQSYRSAESGNSGNSRGSRSRGSRSRGSRSRDERGGEDQKLKEYRA